MMMKTVTGAIKELADGAVASSLNLEKEKIERLLQLIGGAGSIFVMGAGQSGLIARALAMRLAHLGYRGYVVGDVTTPGFKSNDTAIVISHSGETPSLVIFSQKVKELGGKLVLITSCKNSPLACISDCTIVLDVKPDKAPLVSGIGDFQHKNASGTLFGASAFLFIHGLVLCLAQREGKNPEEIDNRHANLQ